MQWLTFQTMACELFMLTVVFILPCAIAQERIVTTADRRVYLKCDINSTQDVIWSFQGTESNSIDIYTCQDSSSGQCTQNFDIDSLYYSLQVNRSNDASVLSLIPTKKEQIFQCRLGNGVVKTFTVSLIDSANITQHCSVSLQSISISGDPQVTLSCGFTFQDTIDATLTIRGLEQNNVVIRRSSHGINGTIPVEQFNNLHDAYCEIYFPDIDETRSCTYPNITKKLYISEGNEIVIACDVEYDVDWYLIDLYGRKEDIYNRSWIRDGGRKLLIQDISERDLGKVVVCQTKGDDNQTNKGHIGFHVISKVSGDKNKSNSEDPAPTPSDHNPYLVLTLLFLSLWLITTAVGGVLLWIRSKRNKSGTLAIALASGNASVPNVGSEERETTYVNDCRTEARRDPETSNTNNSAHNTVFEPEVNDTGENNRNRQSNNESHLYFTLEKTSPSPMNSLPRALTARWEHPDANPVSLNHPQSSQWQGYETVGGRNKGATCSYDLGEYAEVGKHFQGKSPPDLGEYTEVGGHFQVKGPPDLSGRPSIRKKPGREKIKGDDIYSKVNK